MADKKDEYTGFLLDDINSKFDAVLEAVGGMQDQVKKIPKMAESLEKLEYDMVSVKLATTSTSQDMKMVKIRTEKLEGILDEVSDLQKRVQKLEAPA